MVGRRRAVASGRRVGRRWRLGRGEQLPGAGDVGLARGAGEEPVMTDAVSAVATLRHVRVQTCSTSRVHQIQRGSISLAVHLRPTGPIPIEAIASVLPVVCWPGMTRWEETP